MPKNRREFLGLAAPAVALAALLAAGDRRALATGARNEGASPFPGHDAMPLPHDSAAHWDVDLVRRIKAISNVFEVGRAEPDYAYVEDLGDGRGFTVTQYGFCTYNSEVAQVIERYAAGAPGTPLRHFLPHLPPRVPTPGPLAGFAAAWRNEIKGSKLLAAACDEEADALYVKPSMAAAASAGVLLPIGEAIFYDTWLQHGASGDPDSLSTILQRTIDATGGIGATSEPEFLGVFLAIRKSVLHEPHNPKTRDVWRASARRVDALANLLEDNPQLTPPIQVFSADVDVVVL